MDWNQFAILLATTAGMYLTMIGMFFCLRTEANADRREAAAIAAADRKDLLQISMDIKQEIKDFHGRLCAIEERYRSK